MYVTGKFNPKKVPVIKKEIRQSYPGLIKHHATNMLGGVEV
jgi:hypothetical protein